DDRVYVVGDFGGAGGSSRTGMAAFDATSGALSALPRPSDASHFSVAVAGFGGRLVVGSALTPLPTVDPGEGCLAGFDLASGARLVGLPVIGGDSQSSVAGLAGDDRFL